ncbi:hypothetical protein ES706_05176 [subsurface metagenome]
MPQFSPEESKTARVPMTNPTGKAFDYVADLYMGTNLALMAETSFHLEALESKNISLPITMPAVTGTYPVYIGVFSGGVNIGLWRATEDVVIAPVGVAEFVYVSSIRWTRPGGQHRFEIDVQNVGNIAGVCSLAMLWRERYESLGEDWRGWHTVGLSSATLQPGETRAFSCTLVISYVVDHFQVYFTGSPGTSGTKELGHTPREPNGWWQV